MRLGKTTVKIASVQTAMFKQFNEAK